MNLSEKTNEVELKKFDKTSPDYKSTVNNDSSTPEPSLTPELARKVIRGPLAPVNRCLTALEDTCIEFYKSHKSGVVICFLLVLFILYVAYFVTALVKNVERAHNLIYVTAFFSFCFLYWIVKKFFGEPIWQHVLKPISNVISSRIFKWVAILAFIAFVIFWIAWDTSKEPERLISLVGLIVYILIGYLFSKHRNRIIWRPVLWGFALQFIFGLLILRTNPGFLFFKWLGDRVALFLDYSKAGSEFLFDKRFMDQHYFAFVVLPVIVYFSAFTYVLYYLGLIQLVIVKIAWILQVSMGTSPAESVNAAGNIFVGQTEAPLLIRPFLEDMTESELHCVMTGGFATIAGSVLGAYISMGVSPSHLLSASVMSAPAALAMGKLMYPEVDEPKVKNVDDIEIEKTPEHNVLEAVAVGASMSISLVANIAVMLIAFLSLLRFLNALLGWLGSNVDVPDLSFEYICSYVLMPFAYIMGVEWKDSFEVAKLLGTKTFLNEFLAYDDLSKLIKNRILKTGGTAITLRSEVIATYALCGFANFGSMGVQLGGISALVPSRQAALSRVVFRALCAGTMACFMTACIAGMLYEEGRYDTNITPAPANTTVATTLFANVTLNTTIFSNFTTV